MVNDAISTMLKRYRCQNVGDYQNALKEIFQELALLGLWRAKFFENAAFYGGTALRLLYGLDRFSEDLDFSLLTPNIEFDLSKYHEAVKQELLAFGFESSVVGVSKTKSSPIQSAFIKANTLKQFLVIQVPKAKSISMHTDQTMKIKFEVDTNPPLGFQTTAKILLQPIPFAINTYQMPDLFAGKLHAVIARAWKTRIKGRDWYDFAWYVGRGVPVRISHLASRLIQSGHLPEDATLDEDSLRNLLIERITKIDFDIAKNEVRPFLKDTASIALWSKEFFAELCEQIKIV